MPLAGANNVKPVCLKAEMRTLHTKPYRIVTLNPPIPQVSSRTSNFEVSAKGHFFFTIYFLPLSRNLTNLFSNTSPYPSLSLITCPLSGEFCALFFILLIMQAVIGCESQKGGLHRQIWLSVPQHSLLKYLAGERDSCVSSELLTRP